jgi:hypothetical protein
MSPTSRSLALLRREGWTCDICERWVPGVGIRRDLFHIADLIAIRAESPGFVLVQTTSGSNVTSRVRKIQGSPIAPIVLGSGGRIEVHGWLLRGGRWHCRRIEIRTEELTPVEIGPPVPRRKPTRRVRTLFDHLEPETAK